MKNDSYGDSTERTTGELTLFALGFVGFMIAIGGLALASLPLAVFGAVIFITAVYSLGRISAGKEK